MTLLPRQIFHWHVLRYLRRHKLLAALNILSVALGVSVFLAIQIANESAGSSFRAGVDVVAGRAEIEVRGRIPNAAFPEIQSIPGIAAATPLVQGVAALADGSGEYLQILGVDPFTDEAFRTFELITGEYFDIEQWLRDPEMVAVTGAMMSRLDIAAGDALPVLVQGKRMSLRAGALVDFGSTPAAGQSRLAVMDIGWAQELLGDPSHVTAILIRLEPGADRVAVEQALAGAVPPDVLVGAPEGRSRQVDRMLEAFQLNLTALSMVSLLVGMFLINNTISASVVRRKTEIGILRALGMTGHEIRALFLGEAAMYGLAGALLGIAGGVLLSGALLSVVAETISSLYVLMSLDAAVLPWGRVLLCLGLGTGSSVLAAWLPSREAAQVDPVSALTLQSAQRTMPGPDWRHALAGVILLMFAAGTSWIALATGPALLGFAAAFFTLTGFAMFSPWLVSRGGRLAGFFARQIPGRVELRLAASNFQRSLFRNSVNVAALMAAIAMMIGIGTMIFSFRTSVDTWVGQSMTADLFVSPAANAVAGVTDFLPQDTLHWLGTHRSTAEIDTYRQLEITFRGERSTLATVLAPPGKVLSFVGANDARKIAAFRRPGNVIVTESFATRFKIRDGDSLDIPTPQGIRTFEVAGTYYDYTSDRGVILMHRENFDPLWNDSRVQSAAVTLIPGTDPAAFEEEFLAAFGSSGELLTYSNAELRKRVLEIFDQTFSVTYVLRTISVIVAVIGIFLTLTTLVTERVRELGILKSMGASAGQIRRMVLAEAALTGLVASALGLAAGVALSVVLTFVINKAFFGWTIALMIPWGWVWATPLWIVPVSLLAAWLPARAAARTTIATAVRTE